MAESDLGDIWGFIGQDSPRMADKTLDRLAKTFERLARRPNLGRARPELGLGLRSFPVGAYLILYVPADDGIIVARVLSGYRDLGELFGAP